MIEAKLSANKTKIDIIGEKSKINQGVVGRLISDGIITQDQLQVAVEEMKNSQDSGTETIIEILVKLGFVSDKTVLDIVNPHNQIKQINLMERVLNQDIVKKLPRQFAILNKVVPIDEDGETVTIATENVANVIIIDKVKKYFDYKKVKVVHASEEQITKVIDKYHKYSLKMSDIVAEIENSDVLNKTFSEVASYKDPIVRLVDAIMIEGVSSDASDIHLEPEEYFVRIRCRIDGVLSTKFSFHKKYWSRVVGRIKIMSGLNIAEFRKPQDGGMSMDINDKKIDFRVSMIPTTHGENVVLRILDCSKSIVDLKELGFSAHNYKLMQLALKKPEGIIILTGPTGSGKTTTLYSLINSINNPSINIMTLEDPIEYSLPLIRQTQVNIKAGLDFAAGLRSILRQDPDVVMIGEIRDFETADIAIKASLTGHQVFSTLHTNDAISGVARLIDIGVMPFLIGSALSSVIAQRLVRKLCLVCKKSYVSNISVTNTFNKVLRKENKSYKLFNAVGCSACFHTGYKGRTALVEVFYVNKIMAAHITENKNYEFLYKAALDNGFVTMQEDGIKKVINGETSFDELINNINMNEYIDHT